VLRLDSAEPSLIASELGISAQSVSESLSRLGLPETTAVPDDRVVDAVVRLVGSRGGLERLSRPLRWNLFELLVGRIMEAAGLRVWRGVVLSHSGRRVQIDLVGAAATSVYVVECKRWLRSFTEGLALREAARHRERARVLASVIGGAGLTGPHRTYIVPVVVALYSRPMTLDSFVTPPRTLLSLIREHPAALPSPPTISLAASTQPIEVLERMFASRRPGDRRQQHIDI